MTLQMVTRNMKTSRASLIDGELVFNGSLIVRSQSINARSFVAELPPTQFSPTYDQSLAYRHSLFTQPPCHHNGPQFASKPVRRGAFGPERRIAPVDTSSSPPKNPATDQYSMDSFVVEDDDDVLLHEDSQSSSI